MSLAGTSKLQIPSDDQIKSLRIPCVSLQIKPSLWTSMVCNVEFFILV